MISATTIQTQIPPVDQIATKITSKPSDFTMVEGLLDFLLEFNIILMDKFNQKSNLVLPIIQAKCDAQSLIKQLPQSKQLDIHSQDEFIQKLKKFIKGQHSTLIYVFRQSHYWNVHDMAEIYKIIYNGLPHSIKPEDVEHFVKDGSDIDILNESSCDTWNFTLNDLQTYEILILCCSDSMAAFKSFENSNDNHENHVLKHHHDTKHACLIRAFKSSGDLTKLHAKSEGSDNFDQETMSVADSSSFQQFHKKRIDSLGLRNRSIF